MKVDAHVHIWPPGSPIGEGHGLQASCSAETFAEVAENTNVGAAVFVQPSFLGLDHTYLVNTVGADGTLPAASVAQADPDDEESVDVIAALAASHQIAGFRLPLLRSSADWFRGAGEEYWSIAESHRQVVSLLVSPAQLALVDAAAACHSEVPLVIDHLARLDLSTDRRNDLEHLCCLARHENVHVKASVLALLAREEWPYRDTWTDLFAVLDAFGPRRVFWGSDYPFVLTFGSYANAIGALERAVDVFDPMIAAGFFAQNATDLYFSEKRGSA